MTAAEVATLSEFLLARISDDEEAARLAAARNGATWATDDLDYNGARIVGTTEVGNPRAYTGDGSLWDDEGALGMYGETAAHVVRHDPARVLAECEAKRRIVDLYQSVPDGMQEHYRAGLGRAVRCLALPYASRPDYQETWRP